MFGCVQLSLKDIADIKIGEFVHKNNQVADGEYPVYNGGTSNTGFYNKYNMDGNNVVISARGASAGYVNYVKHKYWAGNSCYSVVLNTDIVSDRYLYHYLKNNEIHLLGSQQKGGIPAVSKSQVENFNISIPSSEEQQRIVSILDKFDKLCNDLTSGIPSEIEAIQKAYEYHRNKMLTFA